MVRLSFKEITVDIIILTICLINLDGLPLTIDYLYKNLFLRLITNNQSYSIILDLQILIPLSNIIYVFKIIFFVYSNFDHNKNLNNSA